MTFAPSPSPRHPSAARSTGSPRSGLLVLGLLALTVLVLTVLAPAPALADPPRSVSVLDTTGSVEEQPLTEALEEVDFRSEVDLVVLVLEVTDFGYSTSEDTALNSAVRDHARDEQPELLSADGQHFADGTVILAMDPVGRFLGTYAGEDVRLDEDGFAAVQEAMREDARDEDWESALLAGAERYADLLDRPWWQSPGAYVAGFAAVVGVVGGALAALGLRGAARRRVDRALPRYQDVLARRAATDAAARSLPEDSPYARAALEDHEEYRRRIAEAQQLHQQLPATSQRPWGWGLRSPQRRISREFERTVGVLDETDDAIIAAADLLHRLGDWRRAWERELEPLRDSVAQIDELPVDEDGTSDEERRAAAELIDLGRGVSTELDELTARLEQDRIDPDSALERLDTLTRELSAAVSRLQGLHIAAVAEDEEEAETMREADLDMPAADEEYRSLRARRQRLEHTSDEAPFWHLSPVLWYTSWHHDSTSALESHRTPSSSGTSVSGYSGGGFSGAGSSSRF
ncbi:DUF5129 domain-containing protein [Brachybacterium sp. AOP43-C2-M15]|uniref:DUF5129 domain-containing protein n=1 Tax=Brachybacterium sp. AOP43-C2-M15 TaxID=3457661 RepID=UPI004034D6E5